MVGFLIMPIVLTSVIESIVETALTVRPVAISAAHTVTLGTFFNCDATSGAFAITLPAAGSLTNNEARILIFVKSDVSANAVTVTRAGSDTINAGTTHVLSTQYDFLVLIDTEAGGIWFIIGSN